MTASTIERADARIVQPVPPERMNLTREEYTSQTVFDEEIRKIFHRQWLTVGHISSIKNPGDYFVKQVGPESLIIVRDKQGELHAYFNVCRHRGYQMLDDNSASCAEGIVCPYHRWTYDLEGQLRRVPGSRDGQDFTFADFPLHEAACDVYHGFIYVWLGKETPPPLAELLGRFQNEEQLRIAQPERMKLIHRETYHLDANWKAMLENDLECYHCGQGHPSLAVSCNYQAFFADRRDGQHFSLREGMKTFSMDGSRVSKKPLGTAQDGYSAGFLMLPFFCGPALFVDHAVSLELTPLSPDKSLFISEWYVHEDAVEGLDYEVKDVVEVFHITNLEDAAFGERNYKGIRSSRFVPGPMHPRREDGIIGVYAMYREMMAAADTPGAKGVDASDIFNRADPISALPEPANVRSY